MAYNNKKTALKAAKKYDFRLEDVSDTLKNDKEVVLEVMKNGYNHVSDQMKNNREVVLAAVQQNGDVLQYACADLRTNKDFLSIILLKN